MWSAGLGGQAGACKEIRKRKSASVKSNEIMKEMFVYKSVGSCDLFAGAASVGL